MWPPSLFTLAVQPRVLASDPTLADVTLAARSPPAPPSQFTLAVALLKLLQGLGIVHLEPIRCEGVGRGRCRGAGGDARSAGRGGAERGQGSREEQLGHGEAGGEAEGR